MPEAKRNKVVSLTQTKPKARQHKEFIVNKVHNYLANYKYLYVLTYDNMSTNNFKGLRQTLADSKFLMGKNKVIGVALGTDQQTSYKPQSYRVAQDLKGHCTIFFTNRTPNKCKEIFENFEEEQYATGGTIAPYTKVLQKGFDSLKQFGHSMETQLRLLGLPIRLVNSKLQLMSDFSLAVEGEPISVQKCKVLKLLDIKLSRLKFNLKGIYDGKSYKHL